MLGFGALGEFALGEGPNTSGAPAATIYTTFSASAAPVRKVGLTAAVIATSFVGFVAPPPAQAAIPFAQFSQPVQPRPQTAPSVVNTPIRGAIELPVFASFSQPQFSRQYLAALQPQPLSGIQPPVAYDAGTSIFCQFIPVLRPPLPVAISFQNFAHLTPPDFPPIQEKNDGIFVKKKRKPTKRERDPYAEEAQIKEKRRAAIEDAVFGPVVEYTLPPLAFPPSLPAPPNLGDLPQIMLAAQQAQKEAAQRQAEADDEEDVMKILREML